MYTLRKKGIYIPVHRVHHFRTTCERTAVLISGNLEAYVGWKAGLVGQMLHLLAKCSKMVDGKSTISKARKPHGSRYKLTRSDLLR